MTFTDGKITNGNANNGGGVYNAGKMTFTNLGDGGSIENCYASNHGGGIYNTDTLTIKRGTIGGFDETTNHSLGNMATNDGGGIYNYQGTVNINGGSICYNTATNDGGGTQSHGGSQIHGASIIMTGGSIANNSAGQNAGGVNLSNGCDMTMSGGSITGNTAVNDYGGVYIGGGATPSSFIMTGGSIANNSAQHNYGGIRVAGTMTMTGGSVTGNTSEYRDGGIGMEGTLIMSGNPIVMGNTVCGSSNNVYLLSGKKITVDGAFTSGASVGVTCAGGVGTTFTSDYGTYTHEGSVFASDDIALSVAIESNEAKLVAYTAPTLPADPIPYLDVWEDGNRGTKYCETYTKMSDVSTDNPTLSNGWYVVDKNLTFNKRITINGDNVNLILMDNTRLTANKGVYVRKNMRLHIWGQSNKTENLDDFMGILNATAKDDDFSGIGGQGTGSDAGNLYFHGGFVSGIGGKNAAGIHGAQRVGDGNFSICIYGGSIIGMGRENGAGIGGNYLGICSGVLITGGIVTGIGGVYGAGIGSGFRGTMHIREGSYSGQPVPNYDLTNIRITGGYVIAMGCFGAGIGGGSMHDTYEGDAAYVEIEGGTVIAETADGTPAGIGTYWHAYNGAQAIGRGGCYKGHYSPVTVTVKPVISDVFKVSSSTDINISPSLITRSTWDDTDEWGTYKKITLEVCDHPEHNNPITYTNNTQDGNLSVNCPYCHTTEPYTFTTAGNWNVQNNWLGSIMPEGEGKDVAVKAAATIPSTCCAHVGHIDLQEGGSLTIEDAGQLIHSGSVIATVKKDILGHFGDNNSGWNFIATPIAAGTTPSINNGLLDATPENYDLYYYEEANHIWRNHKLHNIDMLQNGQGYLYAHNIAQELLFEGALQAGSSNGTYTVNNLSHSATELTGFNLVGNPFACNATIDRPAYVINGRNVVPYSGDQIVLAPCEGVIVQADAEHESVTFTKVIPTTQSTQPNPGSLQIALCQAVEPSDPDSRFASLTTSNAEHLRGTKQSTIDNALVTFTEGNELGKFYFGEQNANLYIPQGTEEYAIAFSEGQGEMPLNFKANADGQYTISVNPEGVEMRYLHLIDNMTGTDVDLLAAKVPELVEGPACNQGGVSTGSTTSYTFTAKVTDYESRFRLVFVCGDANDDNDGDNAFAFIDASGNIIVNGEGTLQVIDVTGRVIHSGDAMNRVSTGGMTPGVYVLRLINGNDVKTQKIIVR